MNSFREFLGSQMNSLAASQKMKAAQQELQAQMLRDQQEQNYKFRLWNFFENDYKAVGGALMDWIQVNHDQMGLKQVYRIQDIMCRKIFDNVTGKLYENGSWENIAFHFVVKKQMNVGRPNLPLYISATAIQVQLQMDLAKYVNSLGYTYSDVAATEEVNNSVKITLFNVNPLPQMPYWGF